MIQFTNQVHVFMERVKTNKRGIMGVDLLKLRSFTSELFVMSRLRLQLQEKEYYFQLSMFKLVSTSSTTSYTQ